MARLLACSLSQWSPTTDPLRVKKEVARCELVPLGCNFISLTHSCHQGPCGGSVGKSV